MARALCPGTDDLEQAALPPHTCMNSVPIQNKLPAIGTATGIVKEHCWVLVHNTQKCMRPSHGVMGAAMLARFNIFIC